VGLVLVLGIAGLMTGCSKKEKLADWSTPENSWKNFDERMQKGDVTGAAMCVAYSKLAEQQNSDWGTFAPSQRKLVVDKMRAEWENALKGWTYPTGGCPVQQAQTQGEVATLTVGTSGQSFQVQMVQTEGGWKILSGVPPAAGS
jgi:hypothetical protein